MSGVGLKRVYQSVEAGDGLRVLVDRLWPRGIAKADPRIGLWLKEVAPSDALRREFHGNPDAFEAFQAAYLGELARAPAADAVAMIRARRAEGPVTLVFAAKDTERNNAVVLRALLETGT